MGQADEAEIGEGVSFFQSGTSVGFPTKIASVPILRLVSVFCIFGINTGMALRLLLTSLLVLN